MPGYRTHYRRSCRLLRRRDLGSDLPDAVRSFAAPASASRRLSIGVEPACAAWPRQVTRWGSTPKVPSTTPSGRSKDSSTCPCSMWSSRYAPAPEPVGAESGAPPRSHRTRRAPRGARRRRRSASLANSSWSGHRARGRGRAEQATGRSGHLLRRPSRRAGPSPAASRPRRSAATPRQRRARSAPVEPAAARDRVHVTSEQDRAVGRPSQRVPVIPCFVALDVRGRSESVSASHAGARAQVSVQATRWAPFVVARQLPELPQPRDDACRVEARISGRGSRTRGSAPSRARRPCGWRS